MDTKLYIGLTGSFGSGCDTLRKMLEEECDFTSFKLSKEVREEAKKREGFNEQNRQDLQTVGDLLRKENGTNYLALKAFEEAESTTNNKIVFHGIRNLGEVNEFRKYPNFYLIAVDCSKDNRWKRLEGIYDGDLKKFEKDDNRDKNEGFPHGQQVFRCVEEADIFFLNDENYSTEIKIGSELKERFNTHLGLITGRKLRNPSQEETMMTVASTLALRSHCIKRRVGAVLCDDHGYIISAAYNEVPKNQSKCLDEYGMCYRDLIRKKFNKEIISNYKSCPICSEKIEELQNGVCINCNTNLMELIPSYKALDKCKSLHAEETTILKTAPYQNNNSILYSTTFPCLQCAKRILHTNITHIVYVDPYPEEETIELLEKGDVHTQKFEGVKAQAYYKLFYPYQESLEKAIQEKISAI